MDEFKKDMTYFIIFMLVLFLGWVATGGPEKAHQTGSDKDKFEKLVAPIDSGETYDKSLRDIIPDLRSEMKNPL